MLVETAVSIALGVALQALQIAIEKAKDRSLTTRSILDRLDATISRITPWVSEIGKLSEVGDDWRRKIIEDLKHLLEKAASLVEAYAELRHRNLLRKFRYMRRIKELEASLKMMLDVEVQVIQWAGINELMAKMSEISTKLDEITRQPTNLLCPKKNHSISQNTNQNIVEAKNQSSKENDECSCDGSKLKNDFHLHLDIKKKKLSVNFHFHWDI